MSTVPSNLIPTRISQLNEYVGADANGYLPYIVGGVTYKVKFSTLNVAGQSVSSFSGGTTGLTPSTPTNGPVVLSGVLNVANGGTGSASASGARTALGAAASGANSDITSLTGLTTPLALARGGTGATDAAGARTALGLGTAATTNSTAYATAAQGTKADTAVQTLASADGSATITGTTALDIAIQTSRTTLVAVRNSTGTTLTKGTVVYINGATGQTPTVARAQANSDVTSAQTLGLVTADIANNSTGTVTAIGRVSNINTSAFTDGAQLYLSGTVAGGLTATKPAAPTHLVYVAVVEHAHATQGSLFVKVQNGYEMDELHDVQITSPLAGSTLLYDQTAALWKNARLTAGSNVTITNTDTSVTISATGASVAQAIAFAALL